MILHQAVPKLEFQLLQKELPSKLQGLCLHLNEAEHKRNLHQKELLLRGLQYFQQRQYLHIHHNNGVQGNLLHIYQLKDFPLLPEHSKNSNFQKQQVLNGCADFPVHLQ